MTNVNEQTVSDGVESSFRILDRLTWASLLIISGIVFSRALELAEFPFIGIMIPSEGAYIIFVIITLIHLIAMRHVHVSCYDAWHNLSKEYRLSLYDKLVRTGGLMTKGAQSYRDNLEEFYGAITVKTEIGDGPTWIHCALAILTFFALVDPKLEWLTLLQMIVAFIFISVNWRIGTNWLLALADLGTRSDHSLFFKDGHTGPRLIGTASGFWIHRNAALHTFMYGSIMEAAIIGVVLASPLFFIAGIFEVITYLIRI